MTKAKRIHGAGGGGGGGGGNQTVNVTQNVNVQTPVYNPTYTPDDPGLRSNSFAQMQFLLCEGEVAGPAEGNTVEGLQKSVYLDNTPIQIGTEVVPQPDDLVFSWGRPATEQTGVPGFSQVSTPFGVDSEVRFGLPVAQSITAPDPNAPYRARVLLTFSGLVRSTDKGDVLGTSVDLTITYVNAVGTTHTPFDGEVSGKFSGQFQREFEFELQGAGPWRITVTRNTEDDDKRSGGGNQFRSAFNFSTVVLSLDQRFAYPLSSMLSLGIRADQYASLPQISVDMRGMIIDVPSNYDPETRVYTGTWDGTFKRAFSNNPAWILRDLIVADRYGLGSYIDADQVDRWTLYQVATYCDEQVPAPGGGTEPRFTCNLILQTSEQAWVVLQQLSSIFRGLLYYAGGSIVSIQDRPKPAIFTFNESNTIEEFDESGKVSQGNFVYSGSAQRARHTAVLASWDDPADNYQPRVEYIADEDGIARFGYKAMDLRLLGVTSRGQALRAANWALLSEALLHDTVAFRTNEIGSAVRPGDIVKIADPMKAARRYGGRIVAVSGNTVTLDDSPQIPQGGWAGSTFSYMTVDADGQPELTTRNISSMSGPTVNLVPNSSAVAPVVTFPWLIESPDRTAQEFRILTVEEQEDGIYSFTALRYREDIYNTVDFDTPLEDNEDYFYKPGNPQPPTWDTAQVIWDNNQAKLDLAWTPADTNAVLNGFDLTIREYRLQYQAGSLQDDGSILWDNVWREVARQNDNREQIGIDQYVASDRFKVRIAGVNRLGVESEWAEREVDDITTWFPMPDLGALVGEPPVTAGVLQHFNQSTGSQLFSWQFNVPIPPYVRGITLQVRPERPLTDQEAVGAAPPDADGWYTVGDKNLDDFFAVAMHALVNWRVRIFLTTFVPGLQGDTYATDRVDVTEIYPPTPYNFRAVNEGGAQSRVGQKRFSWEMTDTPPFQEKWPLGYVTDISVFNVRFRHGLDPNWDNAYPLFSDGIPGDQTWFQTSLFDYGEWTVMIRAQDATGWESEDFAVVTVNIGDPLPTNVVERIDLRDQGFPGQLDNFIRVGSTTELMYPDPLTDDMYQLPLDDEFYEGISGFHLQQIDPLIESHWTVPFTVTHEGAQLVIYTQADATYRWFIRRDATADDLMYPPPLTDPFYGGIETGRIWTQDQDFIVTENADNVVAEYSTGLDGLMYRTTAADGADGWHPYAPNEQLQLGSYEARLDMISLDGITRGEVLDTDFVLDYPDVWWEAEDLAVPAIGTRVTFPVGTFRRLKAVNLTVQDNSFAPGVATNAVIEFKDRNFIDIRTIDATGQPVDGVVDVIAVGY